MNNAKRDGISIPPLHPEYETMWGWNDIDNPPSPVTNEMVWCRMQDYMRIGLPSRDAQNEARVDLGLEGPIRDE